MTLNGPAKFTWDNGVLSVTKRGAEPFLLDVLLRAPGVRLVALFAPEHGLYGVEAASRHYFRKSAAALTRDEATRLAAIISSPRKHSPFENSRFLGIRKNIIRRKTGG